MKAYIIHYCIDDYRKLIGCTTNKDKAYNFQKECDDPKDVEIEEIEIDQLPPPIKKYWDCSYFFDKEHYVLERCDLDNDIEENVIEYGEDSDGYFRVGINLRQKDYTEKQAKKYSKKIFNKFLKKYGRYSMYKEAPAKLKMEDL